MTSVGVDEQGGEGGGEQEGIQEPCDSRTKINILEGEGIESERENFIKSPQENIGQPFICFCWKMCFKCQVYQE